MNEKSTLVKNFAKISMGSIIAAVVNALMVPMMAYFLTPDQYGIVGLFTISQTLVLSIGMMGIDQAYAREYYSAEISRDKLRFNCMAISLSFAVALSLAMMLFSAPISEWLFGSPDQILPLFLLAALIPLLIIERYILVTIRMEEKSGSYALLTSALKIVSFIIVLCGLLVFPRTVYTVLLSTVAGQFLLDMFLIIRYRSYLKIRRGYLDYRLCGKLFLFGAPLGITIIIGWALNSIDRFFLKEMVTGTELGIYTAAYKIIAALSILQTSFATFWAPVAYRWNAEGKDWSKFIDMQRLLSCALGLFSILLITFKSAFLLIFPAAYHNLIYMVPLLTLQPVLYTINEVTGLGIRFSNKSYYNTFSSISALLVTLVLNILLIPIFGARGSAMATGASFIVLFIMNLCFAQMNWKKMDIKNAVVNVGLITLMGCVNTFIVNESIWWINAIIIISFTIFNRNTLKKGKQQVFPVINKRIRSLV